MDKKEITKTLKIAKDIIEDKADGMVLICQVTEETTESYQTVGSVVVHNMSKAQILEQVVDKFQLTNQDLLLAALINN